MTSREAFEIFLSNYTCKSVTDTLVWETWQAAMRECKPWMRHSERCAAELRPAIYGGPCERDADPCDCGLDEFMGSET